MQENVGFARANNQAIMESKGEYILLLNSDTEVHEGAGKRWSNSSMPIPEQARPAHDCSTVMAHCSLHATRC